MLSLARGKEGIFRLVSSYRPEGDQPAAIEQLVRGVEAGDKHQVLLGVTGSGKTFTMAKVIEAVNRPAPRIVTAIEELAEKLHPEAFVEKPASDNVSGNTVSDAKSLCAR